MSINRKGTPLPQIQRNLVRYDPEGGYSQSTEYKGHDPRRAINLFNAFARAGVEVEITSQFGVYEVSTKDTRGDVRIDRWEVNIDEEQPGQLQNPLLNWDINNTGPVLPEHQMMIAIALEKGVPLDSGSREDFSEVYAKYPTTVPPASDSRAFRIYEQMRNGDTQYQTNKMVVCHVTNVSNRYRINIADTNVNRLYSHAQFISECTNTNLWIYPMPGELEYALDYFYNQFQPPDQDFFFWSWLKSASPRVTTANNRVEIITKFKLDQWSTDRYALAD